MNQSPEIAAAAMPLLVLICGPYLSGTDGDPARIAANRARLESYALPVYARGHVPMVGEWVALPIIEACNYPGHVPFPCPVCGVPYCTLCDSHGCE